MKKRDLLPETARKNLPPEQNAAAVSWTWRTPAIW